MSTFDGVNSPSRLESSTTKNSWWQPVLLVALFIAMLVWEYLLYRKYLIRHVINFFPIKYDQLSCYLSTYRVYYEAQVRGAGYFLECLRGEGMKGELLPGLCMLAACMGGPNRFAIACANFALFIVAQIVLLLYSYRRAGLNATLLSIGFFFFATTLLGTCGGIFDLRREIAGIFATGLSFMAALDWLRNGNRRQLWTLFAAMFLTVSARFITVFYWTGAAPISLLISLALRRQIGIRPIELVKRHAVLLGSSAFALVAQLIVFWKEFSGYYLNLKRTPEDAMRWVEFGVHESKRKTMVLSKLILNALSSNARSSRRSCRHHCASSDTSTAPTRAVWYWTI